MEKKWELKKPISLEFRKKFPEIPGLILQLLYNRGIQTQSEIDHFLTPDYGQDLFDPFLFSDMKKAVKRIYQAVANKEKITIHGDYDADGVTSTVLVSNVLTQLKADFDIYLPHREKEGYGLNSKTVKYLIKNKTKLVITVDCGISNFAEIKTLQENGIDVIITDHHHEPPQLPPAFAIIDPQVKSCKYPFKSLAGVGVAFKLAQAIVALDKDNIFPKGFEKWLLDLVAIGTVADLMPLSGENRTLVKYGLIVLNKTQNIGLKLLAQKAGLWPITEEKLLNTENIGFILGPRINSAGRVDHANVAYQLLTTKDKNEAQNLVDTLEASNQKRQRMTDKIVDEARNLIKKNDKQFILVLQGKDWPLGVIGLAAARIKEEYNLPVVVISQVSGKLVASGRSIPDFNLIEALEKISDLFLVYGGHSQAAGFTLKNKKALAEFEKSIGQLAKESLLGEDLRLKLDIEASLDLEDLNWDLFDQIEKFEPFGATNQKPLFVVKNLIVESFRAVGNGDKHLKLFLKQDGMIKGFAAIGFWMGDKVDGLSYGDRVDVVCEVRLNEFNGTRSLELFLVDLKKHLK